MEDNDKIVSQLACDAHNARMVEFRIQDSLVRRLTGLHHSSIETVSSFYEIISKQRTKIVGLKLQITQMKRGYERKITKLQRRIADLEAK